MPSGPCGPRKGVWNLSSEGPLTGSDMVGVCLDRPSDLKYCRGVMAGRLRGWPVALSGKMSVFQGSCIRV